MVDGGQLHVFQIAQSAFVGSSSLYIINKVQVLEQGGTVFRVAVESPFHHVGTQAEIAGEYLHNQAGVAIADALQDNALDVIVHQFWMRILVANLSVPCLVLVKMR